MMNNNIINLMIISVIAIIININIVSISTTSTLIIPTPEIRLEVNKINNKDENFEIGKIFSMRCNTTFTQILDIINYKAVVQFFHHNHTLPLGHYES